jgi:phage/plasmid-associated DNA primase
MLKYISSAGLVKGERKYKDPFEFRLTFTPWGASNDLPPVKNDDALWGRVRLFELTHVFGPNQAKMLELETVESLQNLFIWIYGGREAYWNGGINKIPKPLQDAVGTWRDKTDWVGRFAEECLEKVEMQPGWSQADFDAECSTLKEMYEVNRWWREGQGISKFKHPLMPNFKEKLEKRGICQSAPDQRRRKIKSDRNSSKEHFMVDWRVKPEVMQEYLYGQGCQR